MKRLIILSMISFCLLSQTELKAQFKLQLIKIICLEPEESSDDETYINVAGKHKVWHYNQDHSGDIGDGDLDKGDQRTLTHLPPYRFNCPIFIEIMEGDGGGESDDLLGILIVNIGENDYRKLGKVQSKNIKKEDWHYQIEYKISLDN